MGYRAIAVCSNEERHSELEMRFEYEQSGLLLCAQREIPLLQP